MNRTEFKSVIMVPEWTVKQLQRDAGMVSDILSLEKISTILSSEELACLILLNEREDSVFLSNLNIKKPYSSYVFGVDPNRYIHIGAQYGAYATPLDNNPLIDQWFPAYTPCEKVYNLRALYPLVKGQLDDRLSICHEVEPSTGGQKEVDECLCTFLDVDNVIIAVIKPRLVYDESTCKDPQDVVRLRADALTALNKVLYPYKSAKKDSIREIDCRYVENLLFDTLRAQIG